MKTILNFLKCFSFALAISVFTLSCQKDNLEDAVLPQTIQGEQGATGTQGEPGINGTDGKDGEDGARDQQGFKGNLGQAAPMAAMEKMVMPM